MSVAFTPPALAAPLGRLEGLPRLERHFVAGLRLWFAGRAGQAQLSSTYAGSTLDRFDDLLCPLLAHGRRPLVVAEPGARGVSDDECVLARFVALAAEGAREDAILIATLLVRADVALSLGRHAEALGLSLMRAARAGSC